MRADLCTGSPSARAGACIGSADGRDRAGTALADAADRADAAARQPRAHPARGRPDHARVVGCARGSHEHPSWRGARGRLLLLVPAGPGRRRAGLHRADLRLLRRTRAAREYPGSDRGRLPRPLRSRSRHDARRRDRPSGDARDERRPGARPRPTETRHSRTTRRAAASSSSRSRSRKSASSRSSSPRDSPGTAGRASRPGSSGRPSPASQAPVMSSSTRTRASPEPSRIAT